MIHSGQVQFHEDLGPLLRDIDSVMSHPDNYNNGDIESIMESIVVSGMYRPVYVQKSSGRIIAGNHTWAACKELGANQIPVVELEVSDDTAIRLMIADNEIAKSSKPDIAQLVKLLDVLNERDHGLMGTGIIDQGLEQLRALADTPFVDPSEHMQWPSLCFQVPPHVKAQFLAMTDQAGGDRERFELLLRLAGWDGKR